MEKQIVSVLTDTSTERLITLNKLWTPPVWVNSPSRICKYTYKEVGHDKNDKWQIMIPIRFEFLMLHQIRILWFFLFGNGVLDWHLW